MSREMALYSFLSCTRLRAYGPPFKQPMTMEVLDRAAGYATCQILTAAGTSLVGVGAWSLAAGGTGLVPLTLGSLSLLGAGFACQDTPVDGAPPPSQSGCQKVNGTGALAIDEGGGLVPLYGTSGPKPANNAIEILNPEPFYSGSIGRWTLQVTWRWTGGEDQFVGNSYDTEAEARRVKWGIIPGPGSTCDRGPDDLPSPPPLATDPIPYTDPVTNCNYTVKLLGFVEQVSGGTQDPVWMIEGDSSSKRSSGGVVGGCNFSPTVYYPNPGGGGGNGGGGGGGTPPFEFVPGDGPNGVPNWVNTLINVIAGGGSILVMNNILNALDQLANSEYPGLIYRMVSVCEKNASGEPISEQVEVPIPALPAPDAQLARLDAIVELLQASKNFKQPVCPNERPKLEGNWRTISFRSTQSSPYGKSCIRKRFRYRSLSGIGLGEVVNHWKDFTWTTGSVIVSHKGHSWGTPQVWAATADEGKRVIQHAAREAGFDADQVGEWGISSSSSSRYGVSLPVKVDTTGGYYWITERDGSDGRPIVAA